MLLHLFSFECGAEEEVVIVLSTIICLLKGSFIAFSLRKIFLSFRDILNSFKELQMSAGGIWNDSLQQ